MQSVLVGAVHSEGNMATEDEHTPKCELEGDGCVRLSSILHAFGAPIREEQAWAMCYQTSKCMCKEWTTDNRGCYCLTDTSQLRIHKDGSVHSSTVRDLGAGECSTSLSSTSHVTTEYFRALDKSEKEKKSTCAGCSISCSVSCA